MVEVLACYLRRWFFADRLSEASGLHVVRRSWTSYLGWHPAGFKGVVSVGKAANAVVVRDLEDD